MRAHTDRSLLAWALLLTCFSTSLPAAEPVLVGDINKAGGGLGEAAIIGDTLYFAYSDATTGRELWQSDGTVEGTRLAVDIAAGSLGSGPAQLTRIGDTLWFSADDGQHGRELWVLATGKATLIDLNPGAAGSDPQLFTRSGDQVFFSAVDASAGRELWVAKLDGSGARRVRDLRSGSADGLAARDTLSRMAGMAPLAAGVAVIANDGSTGDELWYSDGSSMTLIEDLASGDASPSLQALPQAAGGKVYFSSNVKGGGYEPYVADVNGAGRLADIQSGSGNSWPWTYYGLGDQVFFTAQPSSGDHYLYVTRGTTASTKISSAYDEKGVSIVGATDQHLYLSINKNALWSTDGNSATELVTVTHPLQVVALDDTTICMLAGRGGVGHVLASWAPGQSQVSELNALDPDGSGVLHSKTRLYGDGQGSVFVITSNSLGEDVLYGSRGSAASTELLLTPQVGNGSSTPTDLVAIGQAVYFQATPTTDSSAESRWYRGASSEGIVEVADLRPGADGWGFVDEIDHAQAIGTRIFFTGQDGKTGREPWILDTTDHSLHAIGPLRSGSKDSSPRYFRQVGDQVLFTAHADATSFDTLWRCDLDGSKPEQVVTSGAIPKDVREALVWQDNYYFTATGGDGRELWISDGSAAGTRQVADINPGTNDALPHNPNGRRFARYDGSTMAVFDGALWLAADDGDGFNLWRYDGTSAERLTRIAADGDSKVSHLTPAGDLLFFRASDGSSGEELWVSDGSISGTRMVADINPGAAGSQPIWLTALGDRVFFVADDAMHGREVWVSDGSAAGTRMVRDINPDGDSRATQLIVVGSTLCFVADDGIHGPELWQSRGAEASTSLVFDAKPGRIGGSIFNTQVGGESARFDAAVIDAQKADYPMETC
ncbi:MAG: ELWxxDGT repeat protein, partial [Planctomycetota bacterium]